MRLYISGPMSGLPELNYPAFHKAARQLRKAGYEVVNPAETKLDCSGMNEQQIWLAYMADAVSKLAACEGVATLENWEHSKGANIEVDLGQHGGLIIQTKKAWLACPHLA